MGAKRKVRNRTISQDGVNLNNPGDPKRLKSGIPRLDYILKGGFLRGGTYVLYGPPGSGKTILANQLCFNLIKKKKIRCLYLTLLTESCAKMMRHLSQLSFFDDSKLASGELTYLSAFRVLEKDGLKGLLQMIHAALKDSKASILILDGLESVSLAAQSAQDFTKFLHELMAVTQFYDTTNLLLSITRGDYPPPENSVVDGVIELSLQLLGPRSIREVTIHKFRGGDFLAGKHEAEITRNGIQIHPRTEIQFDKPGDSAHENRIRMAFGGEILRRNASGRSAFRREYCSHRLSRHRKNLSRFVVPS